MTDGRGLMLVAGRGTGTEASFLLPVWPLR